MNTETINELIERQIVAERRTEICFPNNTILKQSGNPMTVRCTIGKVPVFKTTQPEINRLHRLARGY